MGGGYRFSIDVQFTNHGFEAMTAEVEPVVPEGWGWDSERSRAKVRVPGGTDGLTGEYCANPDVAARVWLSVPEDAIPGRYVVTFRVTWGGRYLGQFRHAIVVVR